MSKNTTCPRESLRFALFWEEYRLEYLLRHHRKTEALAAESEAAKYRQRINAEFPDDQDIWQ